MALILTVNAVDRTSVLVKGSLLVTQHADTFVSVCSFKLYDENHNIAIADGEDISVVDGATTFFAGRVVDITYVPFTSGHRNIEVECQDKNALLGETILDEDEVFSALADSAIIDALFDEYLPAVDSQTHVDTIQDPLTITIEPTTLASALNQICTRTGGYWYVDFSNALHYFAAEANVAAWWLSDVPDQVDSFSYFDEVERVSRATTRLDGVFVIGANVSGWRGTHAANDRTAIVWDYRITTQTGVENRGDAILGKYNDAQVIYRVTTSKAGLRAGMDVRFINVLYGVDDTFTVRKLKIKWNEAGTAYYWMELGDSLTPSLSGQRTFVDATGAALGPISAPRLPTSSRGWVHDLVFSATDHDTVEWALGTITLADGTAYAIDAGNTDNPGAMAALTYVYLDLDTSETVLQMTTDASVAVGSDKLLVAACTNVAAGKDAIFQVFGGEGIGVLITADNVVANTITTNEIAANTIVAGNIAAGAIETDELAALAVTAAKIAANTITADKLSVGANPFKTDGLLLLGPHCLITSTSWRTMRLQEATLSGAFHRVAGKWMGTKALLVEAAGLNYCTAPRMIDANSNGRADGWTLFETCDGAPTLTVEAHPIETRGWVQRVEYTGEAFDVDNHIIVYHDTPAASFAPGDAVVFTADVQTDFEGVTYEVEIEAYNNLDAWIAEVTYAPVITSSLVRIKLVYPSLPAATDHVRVSFHVDGVSNGDTVDIYFGAVNVEKSKAATSFICGALAWCAWSGDDDDSTSTRVKTTVNLDAHVSLLEGNSTATHVAVIQAPYDHDGDWRSNYPRVFALRGADDNNRIWVHFDTPENRFEVYINGDTRINADVKAFSAGDWLRLVLTYDFAGYARLYLNEEEIGSADISALSAPTGLVDWCLGSQYDENYQSGWAFAEYAVYDDILDIAEINEGYQLNRPTLDMLSQDVPGIYILDGRFRMQSSYTGNRIEITADEIAGYDSAGTKQFYLEAGTGEGLWGAGAGRLTSDGMVIDAGEENKNAVRWKDGAVEVAKLYGYTTASDEYFAAKMVAPDATHVAMLALDVQGNATAAQIQMYSGKTGAEAYIQLGVTDTWTLKVYDGHVVIDNRLVIDQGAGDEQIIKLISSDVAHGMTDKTETDVFGFFVKSVAAAGGLRICGLRDADAAAVNALHLQGFLGENVITTKSTGGSGIINLKAAIKSGTTVTTVNANGNLVSIQDNTLVRFIFDAEGEMHSDAIIGDGNDWDEWDDLVLAHDVGRVLAGKWDETLRYNAQALEEAGLLTLSEDEEGLHAFIRHKAMLLFHNCVFGDVYRRLGVYEQALLGLGVDPSQLQLID